MSFARRAMEARAANQDEQPDPAPKPRLRSASDGADKAALKRARAIHKDQAKVRDRRRFKAAPVPTGDVNRIAPADAVGTVFPSRVFQPDASEPVLKDGASNSKIGGDVLVGHLRGAHIVTLTLEERATRPVSCVLWRACMGNSMQLARRWRHGSALEAQIAREIGYLCARHDLVLVRLHVLGDFYSVLYVKLWRELVFAHPGLSVFGFTAWGPDTPIGGEIAATRALLGRRFALRHSGRSGSWGTFTVDFPTERKRLGDAIVCPEQVSAMAATDDGRHCGNCAVCWSCDAPIVFVEH